MWWPECCATQKNHSCCCCRQERMTCFVGVSLSTCVETNTQCKKSTASKKPTLRLSFLSLASCADRSSCRFQAGKSRQRQQQHHDLNHGCSYMNSQWLPGHARNAALLLFVLRLRMAEATSSAAALPGVDKIEANPIGTFLVWEG